MGATMKYVWGSATHQGMVRQNNEDSLYPDRSGESDGPAVLMVADGMGGHVAGEVASRLAINAAASSTLDPGDRVAAANRAIREEVARQPDLQGMGTTLTLVELTPEGTAKFGHVGDSRAYLFRGGELRQLTDDHTVAAEYVALGQLSVEEAAGHPQSHMLTRCLGLTRFVNVDEFDLELEAGDRLLLCSDGLNLMVAPEGMVENLTGGTADEAAWKLVEVANKAGGHDNTSVIVIDVLT
jgi:protein phosphatase